MYSTTPDVEVTKSPTERALNCTILPSNSSQNNVIYFIPCIFFSALAYNASSVTSVCEYMLLQTIYVARAIVLKLSMCCTYPLSILSELYMEYKTPKTPSPTWTRVII